MQSGDSSCFLFNLTMNLRFNAREDKPYYISARNNEIKFGDTDLVIRGDFTNVTSNIRKPQNVNPNGPQGQKLGLDLHNLDKNMIGDQERSMREGSFYQFGKDLTQVNKADAIIPGYKLSSEFIKPSKVEVWTLIDYH